MTNSIKKNPKVSVLMPAYNVEKYIGEAIESILDQTFTDFEFIIIDDYSTDRTWEIIQEYAEKDDRIIILRNDKNSKICITLNNGLAVAKGEYVARMDADDWSYPDRLKKQVEFMEGNPKVVVSGGTMEVCDEKMNILNKRTYNLTDRKIRKNLFRYSPFCHPTVMYKTQIVRKIEGYNKAFFVAQDYDLYFRLGGYGEFANQSYAFLKMRIHGKSSSQKKSRNQEFFTLFIRLKAIVEYGYIMSFSDKLYFSAQFLSMYVVPQKMKFWVFNKLRK